MYIVFFLFFSFSFVLRFSHLQSFAVLDGLCNVTVTFSRIFWVSFLFLRMDIPFKCKATTEGTKFTSENFQHTQKKQTNKKCFVLAIILRIQGIQDKQRRSR